MHFDTKSFLKSTRIHTAKHACIMYVHDRYLQLICPRVFSWSLAFWSEKTEEVHLGLSIPPPSFIFSFNFGVKS